MKKYYFKIRENNRYDFENVYIRKNKDIVLMLLEAIQLINISEYSVDDIDCPKKIILCIDKMSRIIFSYKDKIISFHFPFVVNEYNKKLKMSMPNRIEELDAYVISLLKSIFIREIDYSASIYNFIEIIMDKFTEDSTEKSNQEFIEALIHYLIVTEYGYLRYDHGIERANGLLHPEHHLDINYSSNSTYKIGLNGSIDSNYFVDLLDSKTNAKFIYDRK